MNELRRLVGLRVLATLDDGTAIDGTVDGVGAEWVVYTHATMIPTAADPVEMDGTVLVARSRVLLLQVP